MYINVGIYRVDGIIIGNYSDFGVGIRVVGYSFDFDDVVIDFWYFYFEQFGYEFRCCVGQEDLWIVGFVMYVFDVVVDVVVWVIVFMVDFFVMMQDCFVIVCEIYDDVVVFFVFDLIVDDGVSFVFEGFILMIMFSFVYFLQDYLFCGLCCDLVQFYWRNFFDKGVVDLRIVEILFGLFYGEFCLIVFKFFVFDYGVYVGECCVVGFVVDGYVDVYFCVVVGFGCVCEVFFYCFDNQIRVDYFFVGYGFGGL